MSRIKHLTKMNMMQLIAALYNSGLISHSQKTELIMNLKQKSFEEFYHYILASDTLSEEAKEYLESEMMN